MNRDTKINKQNKLVGILNNKPANLGCEKIGISIEEVKQKVDSIITYTRNWTISRECYSAIIEELSIDDFVRFYLENINHIKNYSQISNIVKFDDMELLYSLIDKMLLINDITKAKLIFERIEKLEKDDNLVEKYRSILEEKYKSWNLLSLQNYFSVKHLENLFTNWKYSEAIEIYNSIDKKPIEFQNIFLIYSSDEDFLEFVDSRDNFFAHINWVKDFYNLNLFIKRFIAIWNYSYASKIANIIEKKWWNILDDNKELLAKWKEYSENIWNHVFELLVNDKEENKKKVLSITSEVNSFEDLEYIFREEYRLISYNTWSKKTVFINTLSRFLSELHLTKSILEDIEMILNVYRKTWILYVVNNVPFNQKNIDELKIIESKPDDFYLTISDLQFNSTSLYNIFRTYIRADNIDNKWKKYVDALSSFLDLYWDTIFEDKDKIKYHINQLLHRTFKDRFSKYEKEIELLWFEDIQKLEWEYEYLSKYTSFNYLGRELVLSRRTRTLYFLIEKDYKVWVEYFANMNKSNISIFIFLNLANKWDIELHEEKIINYYNYRFSKRFQSEKSKKVWVDQGYEDWYENLPISYVYEMLLKWNISSNLLISFENILIESGIDIKNIKSSTWNIIKVWDNKILDRFNAWDFWEIDKFI